MSEIVVGVDGSESSLRAARWAVAEGVLRSCEVRLITCYEAPVTWLGMGEALGATITTAISADDLRGYSDAVLADALAALSPPEGAEVVLEAIMGRPADVLIAASKEAEMLVLGSRGHGDLGSVLLGSTGMHCVHHASCPVVIVPHGDG